MFHPIELVQAWATLNNRGRFGRLDQRSLLSRWSSRGDGTPLTDVPSVAAAPALLVVVMTYERPQACARLLDRVERALAAGGVREQAALLVIQDAGEQDYSEARARAAAIAGTSLWLGAQEWLGKANFWRSYQLAMLVAERWQPARTLFLHDDVEFEPDLLERADAIWQATADDPRRRVVYLFSSVKDEPEGRWISFARRELPEKGCRLTNWFDLQAFMVDREFFALLDHRMVPIHPNRWKRDPSLSSGVGRQLTLRLRGRGTVYQAWPPLVCHGAEPSLANREARVDNDLDNRQEYALAVARRSPSETLTSAPAITARGPAEPRGASPRPS